MSAIGGYFSLELNQTKPLYHTDNVLNLNTGRNAFEYILLVRKYTKVVMPYFTCDVMLEPLLRNQIDYSFYNIDENLEPVFDFSTLEQDVAFLYTNYFGLKDKYISKIRHECMNLIIDNAQSFYSRPLKGIDTFYSPRKFFGLPDGGYLYIDTKLEHKFDKDFSAERCDHLLIRIDKNAEEGYAAFCINDKRLENQPIKEMSRLTKALLQSIDYEQVKQIRLSNFSFLDKHLSSYNKLKIEKDEHQVPMVFPFWSDDANLKNKLLQNRIYCASYWPNVLTWTDPNSLEYKLTKEVIYLPIDQRYNIDDMIKILNLVKNEH